MPLCRARSYPDKRRGSCDRTTGSDEFGELDRETHATILHACDLESQGGYNGPCSNAQLAVVFMAWN